MGQGESRCSHLLKQLQLLRLIATLSVLQTRLLYLQELGMAPSSIRAYSGSLQPLKYKTMLFIL
jgi:hypothetical protein